MTNQPNQNEKPCQCKNRAPGAIVYVDSVKSMICSVCGKKCGPTPEESYVKYCLKNQPSDVQADEVLKPCLFCGKKPRMDVYAEGGVDCPCSPQGYWSIEEWNNAWAHNRIAELERLLYESDNVQLSVNESTVLTNNENFRLKEKIAELLRPYPCNLPADVCTRPNCLATALQANEDLLKKVAAQSRLLDEREKVLKELVTYTRDAVNCIHGYEMPEDETIWVRCKKCAFCVAYDMQGKM